MFLFLFYAAKVRRKFEPRKKLFHPVTTLFHYATTLSTKHKKKRPPEGNLFSHCTGEWQFALKKHKKRDHPKAISFLYYNIPHTLLYNQLCATHFGKLSEFAKVFLPLNPKFSHQSHLSHPSYPLEASRTSKKKRLPEKF